MIRFLIVQLLLVSLLSAQAGDILRGGFPMAPVSGPVNYGSAPGTVTKARANAKDALARTTQAIQAVQAMQAAARNAAAAKSANNLGADPNHPGQTLPNVPNGLGVGGLQVAPGVPADLAHPAAGENASLWSGAKLPTQTVSKGKTTVNIEQTSQQALLNWQTFNIGKDTTLNFDQSAGGNDMGKWIAFNQINDPSGSPSQILGKMNAQGQVYVINQNGILFGGASQINLHTLVAASLPINVNLISRGLLNNPDAQFLFSSLSVPGGSDGTPAFLPGSLLTPNGRNGDIVVQQGAQLNSPVSSTGKGGRIMLVAPNVSNEGSISTEAGQTILAAGLQVAVAAHASNDPSLRGLDVWVGAVDDNSGTVTNSGMINAPTGSVLMTGRHVNQLGAIDSSTSVSLNGRIDLLASYGAVANPQFDNDFGGPPFLLQNTGVVTFGRGSVTRILPDYASPETVPGTSLPEVSQINVEGLAIHFSANSTMLAPNAKVNIRAGVWPYHDADGNRTVFDADGQPEPGLINFLSGGTQKFLFSSGQIYFDSNSFINVAGSSDVFVPLDQSIMNIELRGSELADSPLQRAGGLRGIPLSVDIRKQGTYNGRFWIGTPLGDATGFAGLIARNAAQLTAQGGQISLQAGGSIVLQKEASLNVSGGSFKYGGGMVKTTRLMQDGRLVDIASAVPDQTYDGVYTGEFTMAHPRWGVSNTYFSPFQSEAHYEAGYVAGASGGRLSITAPSMAIDGSLVGLTIDGPRQRSAPTAASSLALNFEAEKRLDLSVGDWRYIVNSPTPPEVIFSSSERQKPAGAFQLLGDEPAALGQDRIDLVALSPGLLDSFGSLSVRNPDGDIRLSGNEKLSAAPLGSITLAGANISILGDITAAGGNLSFTTYNISPTAAAEFPLLNIAGAPVPPANAGRGLFSLGSGSTLSVAGETVDDRLGGCDSLLKPLVLNGGGITIQSYGADLSANSRIDVSGGAAITSRGRVSYGNGGALRITTGSDPGFPTLIGGKISLGSELAGYSGLKGGSLEIQAGMIQVGGVAKSADTLLLNPDFFRHGGFSSYSLSGIGAALNAAGGTYLPAVFIAPGTQIQPTAESLLALPIGSDELALKTILKPDGLRSPVSLSFSALGSDDKFTTNLLEVRGDIVMGVGSRIVTEPGAAVAFSAKAGTVSLLGSVFAPGGSIQLKGAGSFPVAPDDAVYVTHATPTVYIGNGATLSTAGATVLTPDPYGLGRRLGMVLPGGSISISGNILADSGALLDVSGASAVMDLSPSSLGIWGTPAVALNSGLTAPLWKLSSIPTKVDSNGGTIDLAGSEMLFTDATLLGGAGGSTALGGQLSIFSGRFYTKGASRTGADINLVVTQNGNTIPSNNQARGVGIAVLDGSGTPLTGMGYFAASHFLTGGFSSLDLGAKYLSSAAPIPFGGNVEFKGPVDIAASGALRVAAGGVIQADSQVKLSAPYLQIGQPFRAPDNPNDRIVLFQQDPSTTTSEFTFAPTNGPGSLLLSAGLIDVGSVSLQSIGAMTLSANHGDIRGNGTVSIAGDLILRSAQIYPATLSKFNLFAYDHGGTPGSITIQSAGSRAAPLSAGGSLGIYASIITQGGVLRAPLGSITIGWDGKTDMDSSTPALDAPVNPIAGSNLATPPAQQVTLESESLTSVAALNGESEMLIPFGLSPDGLSWIDPSGANITLSGLPSKSISLAGNSLSMESGAKVDIRNGGDLFAFRWVPGNGGSVDLLGSPSAEWGGGNVYEPGSLVTYKGETWSARVRNTGQTPSVSLYWSKIPQSYAVVPGYGSEFAPAGAFNTSSNAGALSGNPGYVSNNLKLGDRIHLSAGSGLAEGDYTLLPSRYALLPGAFLVTPKSTQSIATGLTPEGASYVSGYTYNHFNQAESTTPLRSLFEVAPASVFQARAEYAYYSANRFMPEAATRLGASSLQRLPRDSGYAQFHGNNALQLQGNVLTRSFQSGRGAMVDISSFADIGIVGGNSSSVPAGSVVLDSSLLDSWHVDSLLIGGLRTRGANGVTVDVRTSNLALDNPGNVFSAPEIILAARTNLSVSANSSLASTGQLAEPSSALQVVGDGALLCVSSDPAASLLRSGLGGSTAPLLSIGAGARIAGGGVILDSSYGTLLDPSAVLATKSLTLGSGQISIVLEDQTGVLAGSALEPHLTLSGALLDTLNRIESLTLQSYRSIDLYGAGVFGSSELKRLQLLSSGLRGFNQGAGTAELIAEEVLVSNPANGAALAAPAINSGALSFQTSTFRIGSNQFPVAGYQDLTVAASHGVLGQNTGSFSTSGNLTVTAPVIAGERNSAHQISASGWIHLDGASSGPQVQGDLGASYTFAGTSITANTSILLPSGQLTLRATQGDITIGGDISAAGTARTFFDSTRYADAGNVTFIAETGNVNLLPGSSVSVAAAAGGGNAGSLSVIAPMGLFSANGSLDGQKGAGGTAGSFTLDISSLPSFSSLGTLLDAGGFNASRNFRVRTGDVIIDGATHANEFRLAADQGGIRVTGAIDGSGVTGGNISLSARDSVILDAGAVLTVAATHFNAAGKGGEILLEAGSQSDGEVNLAAVVDIGSGSTVDLSVADFVAGDFTTPGSSAFNGQFTGKLHLRAPRNATNTNMGINPLLGTIKGASSILAEGFALTDLTTSGGLITGWRSSFTTLPAAGTTQRAVYDSANSFLSTANYNTMTAGLLGSDPQHLMASLVIAPGVEIINRDGDLKIGSANSTALGSASLKSADWNLSDFRFGPKSAPGVLTLRASGDLVFNNALSDGFNSPASGTPAGQQLWLSKLMSVNANLPVNTQSWSYRLASGGDLSAADFRAVRQLDPLAPASGSVLLGKFYDADLVSGVNATTATAVNNRFQVIRTGAGDIQIAARGDVQLRNQFATIYTAGVRLPNPTQIYTAGDFVTPIVEKTQTTSPGQGNLGAVQQVYPAQWSMAGGNVTISAQNDIKHVTLYDGELVLDSSRQMPTNWLYRRGYVDASTGLFASDGGVTAPPFGTITDTAPSTTWWIDFSNFFQGTGALGGGDVTLLAGNNVVNVDASIPTNARMPGRDPLTGLNLAPDASKVLELGGGNLSIRAANNIDGGTYYVERGNGTLFAGGSITTNAARSPSLGILDSSSQPASIIQSVTPEVFDPLTWLPTTLFVGNSQFNVSARGDVLLGPVTNPFLLPQGLNNKFWYKTYFNTFSKEASATVASFGGSVTHRLSTTLPGSSSALPILEAWLGNENLFAGVASASNASNFQPWIRLAELDLSSFDTLLTLSAPSLRSTSFAGDVNLVGPLTLYPSAKGTLDLEAFGNIVGLRPSGLSLVQNKPVTVWTSATVNLSDADTGSVQGLSIQAPLAYQTFVGRTLISSRSSSVNPFLSINALFNETGSYSGLAGSIATKKALHAAGLLHAGDTEPVRLYANGGDITGLTLFSPKSARLFASQDITDVSFYIQNIAPTDISVVSAGRDIIPNNANAPTRSLASDLLRGNYIGDAMHTTVTGESTNVLAGDIQIGGPGVLEVLGGRDLDLGTGANFNDGTGVGITSIGNARNPFLPFTGAELVVGAGLGFAEGLANSKPDFKAFITKFLAPGSIYAERYLPELAGLMNISGDPLAAFEKLSTEEQNLLALKIFYLVLRDSGRDAGAATANPASPAAAKYAAGMEAISTLFPASIKWGGEIKTNARGIRTISGGSILVAAPGGGITMAPSIFGNPLTPPGIVTEYGGPISTFTDSNVDIGQARIFTLSGGDIIMWSTKGNIAAGTAPKTVVTAPPTRVVIDVTSADVQTDLGGLATGGGIGVLAATKEAVAGNIDLIAPSGFVDAGDAGIRATGNLNIAAVAVLNASNISVAGAASGVPAPAVVAAPNIAGMTTASNTAAAASSGASEAAKEQARAQQSQQEEPPSIITVEVIGYGGGEE